MRQTSNTQTQILAEECGLAPILTHAVARSLMIIIIYIMWNAQEACTCSYMLARGCGQWWCTRKSLIFGIQKSILVGFCSLKKTKTFQVATGKLRASMLVHEFYWRRVWMWRSYVCTLGYIHVMADSAMRTKTTTKSERRFVQSPNSIHILQDCLASWVEANLQTCISSHTIYQ